MNRSEQGRNRKVNVSRHRAPVPPGGFEKYGRKSRKELFLEAMNEVVPWPELEALVEPFYPKSAHGGRSAALSIMLRIFFVQQWFKMADLGVEEALYDAAALRRFAGVDLTRAPAPDVITVCRFRQLLEAHELCDNMIDTFSRQRDEKGIRNATGTIADASIIYAPS